MHEHESSHHSSKCELQNFQKEKVKNLNRFFMKNVIIGSLLSILIFVVSVIGLVLILNLKNIDSGLRITLISITATFILTTSKTLIDKSVQIVSYLVILLSEEQRGINKNLGIEIDKIDFEETIDDDNS